MSEPSQNEAAASSTVIHQACGSAEGMGQDHSRTSSCSAVPPLSKGDGQPNPDPNPADALSFVPRLYSTQRVATVFGRTVRTIRTWVRRGYLHPVRVGRSVFFTEEELLRLAGTNSGSAAVQGNPSDRFRQINDIDQSSGKEALLIDAVSRPGATGNSSPSTVIRHFRGSANDKDGPTPALCSFGPTALERGDPHAGQ